jgi:DNA-binding CsgD family transcriptional regulator
MNMLSEVRREGADDTAEKLGRTVTTEIRIASLVSAAVPAQMALESAALLTSAMEALSIPAFVCDAEGAVRALTATAEALIQSDCGLGLTLHRLCADNVVESQAIDDAIAAAAVAHTQGGRPMHRTVVVRGGRIKGPPLVLEVIPLPRPACELDLAPRVLVIARGARVQSERRAAVVQAAYGLTAAETQVAIQLGAGETPQAIAAARGVAVGTVRAQIKTICSKLGVSRQTELIARLNDL